MTNPKSDIATISAVAQLLAVVLMVTALYFARDVFIPLALGLMLSFLLSPVVNRLHRWGVPNVMAVIATAALAFVLLAGGFTLIGRELTTLVGELRLMLCLQDKDRTRMLEWLPNLRPRMSKNLHTEY